MVKHKAAQSVITPVQRRSCMEVSYSRFVCAFGSLRPASFLRLLEMPKIRRALVLPRRHQVAVGAAHVVLLADEDLLVAFRADVLAPEIPRIGIALVVFDHRPGTRERVVDHG